jgi:hypothetical protein
MLTGKTVLFLDIGKLSPWTTMEPTALSKLTNFVPIEIWKEVFQSFLGEAFRNEESCFTCDDVKGT